MQIHIVIVPGTTRVSGQWEDQVLGGTVEECWAFEDEKEALQCSDDYNSNPPGENLAEIKTVELKMKPRKNPRQAYLESKQTYD